MAKKVLLVDDSKSARIVLSRLLQKCDFDVEMVNSGEEALDYLIEGRPDAIFIDYMMDGMDGLEAIGLIKKNPAISSIPIVMCSANEGRDYVTAALSYGAIGILPKPPTKDRLADIVALIEREWRAKPRVVATVASQPVSEPTFAISAEEVRGLAVSAANDAISQQVGPLVEREISSQIDGAIKSHMPEMAELKAAIVVEVMSKLESVIHETNDKVVAEVIETHFRAQWEEFSGKLNEQLATFKSGLHEELPKNGLIMQQIRDVAESAVEATATETASRVARDVASNVAVELTEELLNSALQKQVEGGVGKPQAKNPLVGMVYVSTVLSVIAVSLVLYLMR
ncbi:MAG: response regulator [Candidatus Polarisedimenticolaceae bacterium]|nr:response regulator [Candidatus Polarisedimenticolaceae bacterium]